MIQQLEHITNKYTGWTADCLILTLREFLILTSGSLTDFIIFIILNLYTEESGVGDVGETTTLIVFAWP